MTGLKDIQKVYFIGIGGIGMSALARYFISLGKKVSGYDRTKTHLTAELEAGGINIHYEENVELAPKDIDVVVYTPAIPADHKELVYYRENHYKVVKRSDVLQEKLRTNIAKYAVTNADEVIAREILASL